MHPFDLPISEKSSTRIISVKRWAGERSKIEWTVRNNTDQASLWKHTITDVEGKFSRYRPGALHLSRKAINLYFVALFFVSFFIFINFRRSPLTSRIITTKYNLKKTGEVFTKELKIKRFWDF